jgi:hypothetical protein
MAFQSIVNDSQPLGWPGQFYDASLRRVTAYSLPGLTDIPAAVGKVFTLGADGNPQLGGDGTFAGILCHPLSLGRIGLESSLTARSGENLELADAGRIIVQSAVAAVPGDAAYYEPASGAIAGTAEGGTLIQIPGARFALFSVEAGGLAVLQLDPGVMIRVETPATGT